MPCPETVLMPIWDLVSRQPAGAPSKGLATKPCYAVHTRSLGRCTGLNYNSCHGLLLGIRKSEYEGY